MCANGCGEPLRSSPAEVMAAHPSTSWHRLVNVALWLLQPRHRRATVKGDLLELWALRTAVGRRDRMWATCRDLIGLAPHITGRFSGGKGMKQDVLVALRSWGRRPGTLLATWLTLALGIGAATAVFTALDALLIRPLPYPAPDRLMHVTHGPVNVGPRPSVSRWFTELDGVVAAAMWQEGGANLELGTDSVRIAAASVSDGFFATMGVPPLLGGTLPPGDTQGRFVVISHHLWRSHLSGHRDVVGQDLSLNGLPYEIVGVMPAGFGFPGRSDVWIPPGADFQITGDVFVPDLVVRLAANVSATQVEQLARRIHDERNRARGSTPDPADPQLTLSPLTTELSAPVRSTLVLLSVSVGVLLLVVCGSVTNILLARVSGRRRELQVRRALGASPWRLARGLLIESGVIIIAGGSAGILLAMWLVTAMSAVVPAVLQESLAVTGAWQVAAFGLGVMVVTATLTGLVPAWLVASRPVAAVVRDGRDNGSGPSHRLRRALIVGQLALVLVLLAAGGAALSALAAATRADLGFGGTNAITLDVVLPAARYGSSPAITGYVDNALAALRGAPGVRRAAVTSVLPGSPGVRAGFRVWNADLPRPEAAKHATLLTASPGYFEALGIRMLDGRGFDAVDRPGADQVAVLSEGAALQIFGDLSRAVGARVATDLRQTAYYRVVGVVADVALRGVPTTSEPTAQIYLSIAQYPPYGRASFVAESHGDAESIRTSTVAAVSRVDPSVPVHGVRAVSEIEARFVQTQRLSGLVVAGFAGVTVLVTAIGLYGLLAQLVSERTREIGIRLALGATTAAIGRRLVGESLALAAVGAAAGAVIALLGLRSLQSVVPSLDGVDGRIVAVNVAFLLVVAGFAAWRPSVRARRVDPVVVLRDEGY